MVSDLLEQWDLVLSDPADGAAASVVAVRSRRAQGARGVEMSLKAGVRRVRDQARALTAWDGHGAIRMFAADPGRGALLLERLEPQNLTGVSVLDSCEVLGHLAKVLDRPAPSWLKVRASDQLRTLIRDIGDLLAGPHAHTLPRRLLERGRSLAADLASEPGIDGRLVHASLHQEHVLWRPDPGEWVAVSPDPVAADPTWVAAPALWHRWEETARAYDLRTHLNFRLDVICDVAGLDHDRARPVSELRTLSAAVETVRTQPSDLNELLTRHVTVIKALQPR